jgi:hypothetical protein
MKATMMTMTRTTKATKRNTRVDRGVELHGSQPPVMLRNARRSRRAQSDCTPLSPMRPVIIRHYMRQQRQLESDGRWEEANWLNAWLWGAFTSEEDLLKGRMPPMRAEFLERKRNARTPTATHAQSRRLGCCSAVTLKVSV